MSGQGNITRSWRAALVGMMLLRVTIGLPALFTWLSPASGEDASPVADASLRRLVPLTEGWLIKQLDNDQPDLAALTRESASPDKTWLSARMPAQVHDVLVAHGLIADPHVGKNAAACAWVGEKDWAYVCRFPTPENVSGPAFLRFEGLDTLADVYLNGTAIGHFENMFREYAVDVKDRLALPGQSNVLVLVFSSPLRFIRNARLPASDPNFPQHKSLRKCHSDFSSYLGAAPHAVKVGGYRDVVLDLPERAWFEDVWVTPVLGEGYRSAKICVRVQASGEPSTLQWTLRGPDGREVEKGHIDGVQQATDFEIAVSQPRLWWPRMQGAQDLYTLDVALRADERLLDSRPTVFGIRDVRPVLTDPATGEMGPGGRDS